MKGTILVTRKFRKLEHELVLKELEGYDIVYFLGEMKMGPLSDDSLDRFHEVYRKVDPVALFLSYPIYPRLRDRFWKEVHQESMKLKIIVTFTTGFDFIDVEEAKKRGIYVTNCENRMSNSTAEIAMWLIVGSFRRCMKWINVCNSEVNRWHERSVFFNIGNCVKGKTLGIFGMGRIGKSLSKKARFGFDMKVIYHNRMRLSEEEESQLSVEYRTFEDLLKECDVLSLHCPLNESTRHCLTEREIRMMKKTAYIVNTSRGKCIKEDDLIRCLEEKVIRGCALDVMYTEPCLQERWNYFIQRGDVCLPHLGAFVDENFQEIEEWSLLNLKKVLVDNEKPPGNVY